MDISALLTSAGINIAVCVVLLSFYSILRKQPSNVSVYFGRRLVSGRAKRNDPYWLERFVPSPRWILKAWGTTEEELLAITGLDAVVFLRMVVFSIRVFSIAAIICIFLVLPVNYYGQERAHKEIHLESLEAFTIGNVKECSRWLWAHCLALYVISCSACILLYFEYKSIVQLRLARLTGCPPNLSHFAVLVRSIPWSPEQSYSESVRSFFTKYYASSYLSHQMVYRSGTIQKLLNNAEKMCKLLKGVSTEPKCSTGLFPCTLCGGPVNSFHILPSANLDNIRGNLNLGELELAAIDKECPAAFVFFKTRFDAVVVAEVLQSSNPMLWVTELAPEPHDIYWSNLCIPYRQLWIRKLATLLGAIVFMFVFLIPVTFIQGLTQLEQLAHAFPFLRGILKKKYMSQLITGYLPSVILMLFLYAVPPTMMLFSVLEGPISRGGRKKSACVKVLYFTIWNVFFVNILSGSVIRQLSVFSSVKDLPTQLAKAVPTQASFFMTYVFTSGWAGLACEMVQPFALICNVLKRFIFKIDEDSPDSTFSFPYHTEIPRILLFGILGFTNSIMAPLILPFLLIYFFLAYLVYRNQILNVYVTKYESWGRYWPVFHNTTIFSLVLTQIIALGVFGIKKSPVATAFTIPLILGTLLFNEYCRQRFYPIFKKNAAQALIEMDREDDQTGRLEEIYKQLKSVYCQFPLHSRMLIEAESNNCPDQDIPNLEAPDPGEEHIHKSELLAFQFSPERDKPSPK